jgi:hypothetical protein
MANRKQYIIGSVSSCTMREEDLIPRFLAAIEYFNKRRASGLRRELKEIEVISEGEERIEQMAYFLNETLFDTLDGYAPPYFYFGSHPGDGADYGFWLSEESLEEFDGLRVADLSEVPKGYRGEVLLVNDHGNTSLYAVNRGKFRAIWELV